MIQRAFGNTGLTVSALGLGAVQVGEPEVTEAEAGRLLNRALDLGVTLIDTARGYGLSEERVGRHLSGRRDDFVLSSKGGYGVEGVPDWTPESIRQGVERALRVLRTDHIDIFHLHSPPLEVARQGDLLQALDDARQAGHIRVTAYSGENEALAWAVESGRFGSVQTSVNIVDQWSLHHALPTARARGLGVIGKRPVANVAWRFAERPVGEYAEVYWERLQAAQLDLGDDPTALALRFSAFAPGVDSVITGTRSLQNLERNVQILQAGPLPQEALAPIQAAWATHGAAWSGQV